LSVSGVSSAEFTFLGFLPHKKGREKIFKEIAESKKVIVFYESTHRILKTLDSLNKYVPKHKVVIAREMTKQFEEFIEGDAIELISCFEKDPVRLKGEFVVIVKP
jgi:16S rRNA (cytidine1402-2'-O)-methyltransferase